MAKNIVTLTLNNVDYTTRPYSICETAGNVANKVASCADFKLTSGATILVKFTNNNSATGAITLNVNSTGAKPIKCSNRNNELFKDVYYEFMYNGTEYMMLSNNDFLSLNGGHVYGDLYCDKLIGTASDADKLDGHDSTYFATKTSYDKLSNQINALSLGMKLSATVSNTVIYKATDTNNITFTATLNNPANATINSMTINDGSSTYSMSSTEGQSGGSKNKYTYKIPTAINLSTNSKSYTITAKSLGMDFVTTVTINARYPVYMGMGKSATEVKSNANNKQSPRTSAIGYTYKATASDNEQSFYLLIPSDVSKPTSAAAFSMGGSPVDMVVPTTTTTIDGINYYVFYTNATYNNGAVVEIEVN
jgi:hypothetical protein